ncbi:MAG TPA: hypothetical protein VI564_05785 [Candidatus Nanoarchaeia archaeon]|nr:hypothetical protein [Candidatus Nanoarchaeia archaeon]
MKNGKNEKAHLKEQDEILFGGLSEENPAVSENIPKKESITRKIIIAVIGIFLLILTVSYLLPGYNFFSVISGQADSYKVLNNEIKINEHAKIIFENSSYDSLLEIYYQNQQHEFKACLIGTKTEGNYYVNSIVIPQILHQDFSSVTAMPCKSDAVISLHSHPYKSCYFSLHDISTYKYVKEINSLAIMAVMCEAGRFNFYGIE